MSTFSAELSWLAPLLPEEHVGQVQAIQPIAMGLSGAAVYSVSTTRGERVLRVQPEGEPGLWEQQLRILRRAAERGLAPALLHVDTAARAIVSARVMGAPLAAALADAGQRGAMMADLVTRLRELHALEVDGLTERDPLALARAQWAIQRERPGFPRWASALDSNFAAIAGTLARDPRRVVSHNDLNPSNILWDGTHTWLVDWEVAGRTHPFYDLAVLSMFLRLDDATAFSLLKMQEQRPVDDEGREVFAALRRLAALLSGLTFSALVPDLDLLPATAPTLVECYAGLRAGALDLRAPAGRGAFALALLQLGMGAD
jgi:Ser/Thr protein kinase RdoA (MazF antagonist)